MRVANWSWGLVVIGAVGCSSVETRQPESQPEEGRSTPFSPRFSMVQKFETEDVATLTLDMSETMVQFAQKLKADDAFQLWFHQFWGDMARTNDFDTFGFAFRTISPANTVPLRLQIKATKKGTAPGYLDRDGDNPHAFDYIIAQSTFVKKLQDPASGYKVERVEVTPLSRSFSTPGGTRLIIPTGQYKTIVDFSRKASEEERRDFWGLVAREMAEALAVGKFIEMGVHCGDLHGQTVGHFHFRLTML